MPIADRYVFKDRGTSTPEGSFTLPDLLWRINCELAHRSFIFEGKNLAANHAPEFLLTSPPTPILKRPFSVSQESVHSTKANSSSKLSHSKREGQGCPLSRPVREWLGLVAHRVRGFRCSTGAPRGTSLDSIPEFFRVWKAVET